MSSFIPNSAPFSDEQRAWLNGFFSGLMGIQAKLSTEDAMSAVAIVDQVPRVEDEKEFPWHDPALPIVDRMELAQGKPIQRQLMAAMAQLDCGSCGYECKSYSEAIASGEESNLTLCSPGGKETKQMIKKLLKQEGSFTSAQESTNAASQPEPSGWTRQNPFSATIIENRNLNGPGSTKETRHVTIDLADSDLKYEVGDALGVFPTNCPELVATLLEQLSFDPELSVERNGKSVSLKNTIIHEHCLKDPSEELIELLIGRCGHAPTKAKLLPLLDDGVPAGFDVLDLISLAKHPQLDVQEFLATLEPMNARLYSIASSMDCVGNEVHLTVGKVSYERDGRLRKGVASTMFSDRVAQGDQVRVFVQPNHGGFTVPSDANAPMIMVGPGTGIAPFIAFLQQRQASNASGKNWLFFGDQHQQSDFLYEGQLKSYQEQGLLTRLDTAFSRDGDRKTYVQHRMQERGETLWQWITEGAYFFVCGDASRMATDVDDALTQIVAKHGEMPIDQAKAFIEQMTRSKRYVRDVY